VLRTNMEAATQVVQQLRLRNIGGIVVIDFIDMEKAANRKKVFEALQEALKKDKARSNVLRISELGLVQMTRKRTRESLGQLLTSPCSHCDGLGRTRAVEARAYDALRALQRTAAHQPEAARFVLHVPPDVADFLAGDAAHGIGAAEKMLGRPVAVEPDPELGAGESLVRGESADAGVV